MWYWILILVWEVVTAASFTFHPRRTMSSVQRSFPSWDFCCPPEKRFSYNKTSPVVGVEHLVGDHAPRKFTSAPSRIPSTDVRVQDRLETLEKLQHEGTKKAARSNVRLNRNIWTVDLVAIKVVSQKTAPVECWVELFIKKRRILVLKSATRLKSALVLFCISVSHFHYLLSVPHRLYH